MKSHVLFIYFSFATFSSNTIRDLFTKMKFTIFLYSKCDLFIRSGLFSLHLRLIWIRAVLLEQFNYAFLYDENARKNFIKMHHDSKIKWNFVIFAFVFIAINMIQFSWRKPFIGGVFNLIVLHVDWSPLLCPFVHLSCRRLSTSARPPFGYFLYVEMKHAHSFYHLFYSNRLNLYA